MEAESSNENFVFDQAPKPIRTPKPRYPELAIERGIEGVVKVKMDITAEGVVSKATVIESDHKLLNIAAQEAGYKFLFEPARQDGVPVKCTIVMSLEFTLPKS